MERSLLPDPPRRARTHTHTLSLSLPPTPQRGRCGSEVSQCPRGVLGWPPPGWGCRVGGWDASGHGLEPHHGQRCRTGSLIRAQSWGRGSWKLGKALVTSWANNRLELVRRNPEPWEKEPLAQLSSRLRLEPSSMAPPGGGCCRPSTGLAGCPPWDPPGSGPAGSLLGLQPWASWLEGSTP